jgi:hypothetical protein
MKRKQIKQMFRIVRETSAYNKYIKWFARIFREDGTEISSCGYKTQREARESILARNHNFEIGNKGYTVNWTELTA